MKKYIIKFNDSNCVELSKPINTILVYRIPYQAIKNKTHNLEILNRFIVYILFGKNTKGRDLIYVGKSKNGIDYRPTAHEDKNAFWTDCYVLTDIKERTILNDGTIQYLEDKICNQINNIGEYVNTTNQTTSGTANHSDMEDCDEYLKEAFDMLYVLGLDLHQKEKSEEPWENVESVNNDNRVDVEQTRHSIKPKMMPLYEEFMKAILHLNKDIIFTSMKVYIKGTIDKKQLFSIVSRESSLDIFLNTKYGNLKDDNGVLEDVRNIGHNGPGDYRIKITDNTHITEIVDFVNQILNL